MGPLETLGQATLERVGEFGDFWRFTAQSLAATYRGLRERRLWTLTLRQMYEIGTLSLPVMMITGMFVGMVLAVQAVAQFKAVGMEGTLGGVVNLSVLRELGPVLSAVLLAGRVGGAMTAELGTMRVTEQIDALRAMGSDPQRHLVSPRLLACVLLGPLLVIYADLMGVFGGYVVSVGIYSVNPAPYWQYSAQWITFNDIFTGLAKSLFFSGSIAMASCFKAFRCPPGAAGVGRACTEAFVVGCMTILIEDFFLNVFMDAAHAFFYGPRVLI
jgi:phospholipid/cholesterol/gamma-HCH transport system permease protein